MKDTDFDLLRDLCEVFAPSGNEVAMKRFLIDYVEANSSKWKSRPDLIHGPAFQDCLILKFGEPRTAVFAHMDSIGFTVRYENQLVPIGSPEAETGYHLVGEDGMGPIACRLKEEDGYLFYDFGRGIQSGTELVFECDFRETDDYVQSSYLDNRLGIYNVLKLAETLQDGLIVFSCGEEHGGGTVPFLCKYIYENHRVKQALISDITWVTEGVQHGQGVAISMRDMSVPRRSYIDKVLSLAALSGIPYQIEVERSGGSDGREIQSSPYPIDWCFIGAPEDHVHSPDEKVHKKDIQAMIDMYRYLMENL
ncbi:MULTISPECIES: M20/M25/M40 family metallo-hydrolase [Reichenbachiella]|uniref:Putative aminopeptidase FrvX n=1 Tax=Reichenbachiella agariperforans TaxID=156994 RepID=A0A1M6NR56_REIAG|nr:MULTISPECIES: M20/M25/M40 family metallo-hydrolase [Reichenbachiella]MBU2915996.1 M20/M25/M40 family metallo-hydrolase [Reichenbachiella agariperforans]RJE71765.1 aminopeptidase [Reichenbachiella sp. MSK19-1]SHJ98052.1 Putative aminopeptidase FrvX [Reichenbachiella agariperforans]